MNPEFRKVALIAASLGLLVSLFLALRPDDEDAAGTPTAATTTAETTEPATTEPAATEPATTDTEPPATTESETVPTAPPADATVTIRIAVPSDVAPTVRTYSVRRNRKVEIVVRTDLTDHVHLHGYDLMADVAPGRPGRIAFTANAPGRFEIELEDRRLLIGELEVRP